MIVTRVTKVRLLITDSTSIVVVDTIIEVTAEKRLSSVCRRLQRYSRLAVTLETLSKIVSCLSVVVMALVHLTEAIVSPHSTIW